MTRAREAVQAKGMPQGEGKPQLFQNCVSDEALMERWESSDLSAMLMRLAILEPWAPDKLTRNHWS